MIILLGYIDHDKLYHNSGITKHYTLSEQIDYSEHFHTSLAHNCLDDGGSIVHINKNVSYVANDISSDDSTKTASELLDVMDTAHFTGFFGGGSAETVLSTLLIDLNPRHVDSLAFQRSSSLCLSF